MAELRQTVRGRHTLRLRAAALLALLVAGLAAPRARPAERAAGIVAPGVGGKAMAMRKELGSDHTVELRLRELVRLDEHVDLALTDVAFETIDADPEDPEGHPGGGGVTLYFALGQGDAPERFYLSEVDAPYRSEREVEVHGWTIALVEVRASYQEPAVRVRVERRSSPRWEVHDLSARIDGQVAEVRVPVLGPKPSRAQGRHSQAPFLRTMSPLLAPSGAPELQVYLAYDDFELLERRGRSEARVKIEVSLRLVAKAADGGAEVPLPPGARAEVDGAAVAIDREGRVAFAAVRTMRAVDRVEVARTKGGSVTRVLPAGLFGPHPEQLGVEPIRTRIVPQGPRMELRWIPSVDEVEADR